MGKLIVATVLHNSRNRCIPNSKLQEQNIRNLSRFIPPVYFSIPLLFLSNCNSEAAKRTMEKIIRANPDTFGNIDTKLKCLERYFKWEDDENNFHAKKENGRGGYWQKMK
ncbi:hypothetical protein QUA54_25050 [Microcoleus sp. MOSTC5]|uniref:hypothetical protein n=1 Tax=Microcoleus sp. MOSTC5 TaxID=3055378 RepID=UPI002FD3143B